MVGTAEQCHGVTAMTESIFFVEESNPKKKMWSRFCCSKSNVVLFLISVILTQWLIFYQEYHKWQAFQEKWNNYISELSDVQTKISRINELEGKIADIKSRPTIYAITPTFARPVQKAELTRLAQTFLHIFNFHWIVVEDSVKKTDLVTNFLAQSRLAYTHLNVSTPPNYKLGKNDPNWKKPRGVEQRNAALRWIRESLTQDDNGIVFFADDDNTYSIKLFREMEKIKTVGVWPVGLVGGLMVEKPICDNVTRKVVGFNSVWKPDRPFPLDMAGFAVNLRLILEHKNAWFSFTVQSGYQESEILRQMIPGIEHLEPLADFCTKVYVWHTRTEPPKLNDEQLLIKKGKPSNAGIEV
ncbi:galactosylgalactosylxylosylprotein 3-beta-glucuronosyltransferase I [Cephus cinctus]|uniref:Galactosylgalactosylxylosylprotein 3-beta-glucuronosyltransferase n=1 Tax=Cephus cinctus TaxID=211228 RepID=A0AAJ7BJK3_CEPCN|nr:galactosylgalactosylxylosylprotein 3-beta-glucuronosyltransferase I [Cephus cinctus]